MCGGSITSLRTHKPKTLDPDKYCYDCGRERPLDCNENKKIDHRESMKTSNRIIPDIWVKSKQYWYCPDCWLNSSTDRERTTGTNRSIPHRPSESDLATISSNYNSDPKY